MKVFVIASGSDGNASLFESRGSSVLVDAGVRPRTLGERLRAGGAVRLPQAIVVTHGHGDHVGHCERIAKRLSIPVYMSESTSRFVKLSGSVEIRMFGPRTPFVVGDLLISPTPLPHDAAQVALVISDGVRSAAIVTDLGEVPPSLLGHIAACDVALIESNHDVEMLQNGPYPAHLKRRILSARGHLSNAQAYPLLRGLGAATHTVVLMHLSRSNNRPDIALESARDALAGRRVRLAAAPQDGGIAIDASAGPPPIALPLGLSRAPARSSPARREVRAPLPPSRCQLNLPFS